MNVHTITCWKKANTKMSNVVMPHDRIICVIGLSRWETSHKKGTRKEAIASCIGAVAIPNFRNQSQKNEMK